MIVLVSAYCTSVHIFVCQCVCVCVTAWGAFLAGGQIESEGDAVREFYRCLKRLRWIWLASPLPAPSVGFLCFSAAVVVIYEVVVVVVVVVVVAVAARTGPAKTSTTAPPARRLPASSTGTDHTHTPYSLLGSPAWFCGVPFSSARAGSTYIKVLYISMHVCSDNEDSASS